MPKLNSAAVRSLSESVPEQVNVTPNGLLPEDGLIDKLSQTGMLLPGLLVGVGVISVPPIIGEGVGVADPVNDTVESVKCPQEIMLSPSASITCVDWPLPPQT